MVNSCVWKGLAAIRFSSISFTNLTPFITSAKRLGRCNRIHLFSAHWHNLNAIAITVLAEKQPLTLAVLNRMVVKKAL
jgi:hypothetical protein